MASGYVKRAQAAALAETAGFFATPFVALKAVADLVDAERTDVGLLMDGEQASQALLLLAPKDACSQREMHFRIPGLRYANHWSAPISPT